MSGVEAFERYRETFGYPPRKAIHLVKYARRINIKLRWTDAKVILRHHNSTADQCHPSNVSKKECRPTEKQKQKPDSRSHNAIDARTVPLGCVAQLAETFNRWIHQNKTRKQRQTLPNMIDTQSIMLDEPLSESHPSISAELHMISSDDSDDDNDAAMETPSPSPYPYPLPTQSPILPHDDQFDMTNSIFLRDEDSQSWMEDEHNQIIEDFEKLESDTDGFNVVDSGSYAQSESFSFALYNRILSASAPLILAHPNTTDDFQGDMNGSGLGVYEPTPPPRLPTFDYDNYRRCAAAVMESFNSTDSHSIEYYNSDDSDSNNDEWTPIYHSTVTHH